MKISEPLPRLARPIIIAMAVSALSVLLVGVLGQFSSQPIKLPRTQFQVPNYPGAFLLSWGLVQDEIGISEGVRKNLQLSRQVHDQRISQMISRPASGQPYRDALSPAQAKALSEITATHRKRLGEIYLQYYDVSALVDPTVSKMVGLAPTQQKAVQKLFDKAHLKYQEAQEAMFETFRKDGEALRKAAMQDKPSTGNVMKTRISYVMPRRIQNQHTHLSRQVALLQTREMTLARAEVRKLLTANQLARLKSLKGKPISQWFYHGSNWGTAQPHPDLALNINVQAEMGFTLKQYLAIQKEMNELRRNPTKLRALIASLTPSQRAMLRRYEIQYDREYSVLRHDVAAELGIDAGLADRIRLRIEEIDAEAQRKGGLEWNKLDQPNANEQAIDKARRAILGKADADKRKAILYMLSASQKAKWRSIVGKPLSEIQPTRYFG